MRGLTHPVAVLALAVWIVNDHLLKSAFHNEVTGKLSDVASLIVFPLLVVTAYDLLHRAGTAHNRVLTLAAVATAMVMATINLFDVAAEAYRVGLAALQYPLLAITRGELGPLHRVRLTMDPSDLLTLPAIAVPLWLGWRAPAPAQTPCTNDAVR